MAEVNENEAISLEEDIENKEVDLSLEETLEEEILSEKDVEASEGVDENTEIEVEDENDESDEETLEEEILSENDVEETSEDVDENSADEIENNKSLDETLEEESGKDTDNTLSDGDESSNEKVKIFNEVLKNRETFVIDKKIAFNSEGIAEVEPKYAEYLLKISSFSKK